MKQLYTRGRSINSTFLLKDIEVLDSASIVPFDARVIYEYEAVDYSDHPYGNGTARESHSATVQIISVKNTTIITQLDNEGQPLKELPIGTNVMKMDSWNKDCLAWFEEQAMSDAGL